MAADGDNPSPDHQTTSQTTRLASLASRLVESRLQNNEHQMLDAHQHFWDLTQPFDYGWLAEPRHAPIHRTYLPADLAPHLAACGVTRSIFVQTQHDVAENRWALRLAEANDFLAGVVGWVDLASPRCEEQVEEFRDDPLFLGVRHITQDEPDDDFIVRPDVIDGLRVLQRHGVPFDLLFYTKHLHHAPTLARELPDLPMVIDHLSKPRIAAGKIDDWARDLRAAAKFENVFCKLSGMVTEADWQDWNPGHLRPYIEVALEAFGPERCMYGSDWPVCELAATYEEQHAALVEALAPLGDAERERILGGTATEFYGVSNGE